MVVDFQAYFNAQYKELTFNKEFSRNKRLSLYIFASDTRVRHQWGKSFKAIPIFLNFILTQELLRQMMSHRQVYIYAQITLWPSCKQEVDSSQSTSQSSKSHGLERVWYHFQMRVNQVSRHQAVCNMLGKDLIEMRKFKLRVGGACGFPCARSGLPHSDGAMS